jgi:uncharacterized protein YggE
MTEVMKKIILLLSILAVSATVARSQNSTPPPLITVSGQAEVRVPPDEVVFTLGVQFTDKDIVAAKQRTDDAVKQVLSIARSNNIKAEDVQTSHISVQPKYNTDDLEYEQRRAVKREFLGYQAAKTIAVILRDISRFDALLADVLKAGVTNLSNLEFRDSKIRQHRDQARVMAIKAAQEKAQLLAREIGQSIGPAYSITEGGVNPYAFAQNANTTANVARTYSEESESATAPGMISVSAQVTVSFRLMQ